MNRIKNITLTLLLIAALAGVAINQRDINQNVASLQALTRTLDLSVLDSCGLIRSEDGYGSCVAVGPDLILTAKHCLDENCWVEIGGVKYEIVDKWASDIYDVGFIRINGILPYIQFGNMPQLLDTIYVVGSPLQSEHRGDCINNITKGIVSNLNVSWYVWTNGIIVDAAAYPGNSGCALLDTSGHLIGIMVGCHNRFPNGGDNFWLAEPVSHILEALEKYNAIQK